MRTYQTTWLISFKWRWRANQQELKWGIGQYDEQNYWRAGGHQNKEKWANKSESDCIIWVPDVDLPMLPSYSCCFIKIGRKRQWLSQKQKWQFFGKKEDLVDIATLIGAAQVAKQQDQISFSFKGQPESGGENKVWKCLCEEPYYERLKSFGKFLLISQRKLQFTMKRCRCMVPIIKTCLCV